MNKKLQMREELKRNASNSISWKSLTLEMSTFCDDHKQNNVNNNW